MVFALVLQHLLKDTELEEKAFNLYADIVERERVPKHQIQSDPLYPKLDEPYTTISKSEWLELLD